MIKEEAEKIFKVLRESKTDLRDDVLFELMNVLNEKIKLGKTEEKKLRDDLLTALKEIGLIIENGEWLRFMEVWLKHKKLVNDK